MRKDVLQCVFQQNDISSKQEQTIELTCEMNCPGIGLDYLDIFPPVFFDALSGVDADHWANLHTDNLTRRANGMNEVRKAPAQPATHVENTIALLELQQLDRPLTHRPYEGRINIGKGPEKTGEIAVGWCEVCSLFFHWTLHNDLLRRRAICRRARDLALALDLHPDQRLPSRLLVEAGQGAVRHSP